MLKYIALALLLLGVAYANSSPTCGDNPVVPLLEKLISAHDAHVGNPNKQFKNDDDKAFDGQSQLDAFKAGTGAVIDDLPKCQSYNSGGDSAKQTCCTKELVNLFPRLTKGFFRKRLNKPPKPSKLLRTMGKFAKKCGSDVSEADSKDEIKTIMREFKDCQKKATIADVNLMRGTLCSLCVAPSDYATYFNEGSVAEELQIKVKAANLDAYDTKMQAGLKCFDDAQAKFKTILENVVANFDQTKCKNQVDRIKEILAGSDQLHGSSKNCKGKAKPLSDEGCLKESEDDGTDYSETRRFLQTQVGGYVQDSNGLDSIYEEDSAENDALLAEDFYDEEVDNHSSILLVGSLIMLVALLL